jgi:signal transduction histidine kinase
MLISLGFYVATSLKRQLTLAAQQVSFSSQVSHELRTPLTNIQLYTEMAERDLQSLTGSPQTESLAQRLHVIGLESQRLSRLCDNVLALVRKPQSTIPDRSCRCIPDECINACLDQFRPAFERLGVRIERHAAAAGWAILDRHALETVMMNLLSNVERYAAAGQWLQIDSRLLAGELVVRVADHGPGIPRRQWKRVFQPFVRLHTGINAPNGTGIGLSIARQVTSHAGGTLQILPAPRGTTIELVLPALQDIDSCAS